MTAIPDRLLLDPLPQVRYSMKDEGACNIMVESVMGREKKNRQPLADTLEGHAATQATVADRRYQT